MCDQIHYNVFKKSSPKLNSLIKSNTNTQNLGGGGDLNKQKLQVSEKDTLCICLEYIDFQISENISIPYNKI
jgi:hypothetical protein